MIAFPGHVLRPHSVGCPDVDVAAAEFGSARVNLQPTPAADCVTSPPAARQSPSSADRTYFSAHIARGPDAAAISSRRSAREVAAAAQTPKLPPDGRVTAASPRGRTPSRHGPPSARYRSADRSRRRVPASIPASGHLRRSLRTAPIPVVALAHYSRASPVVNVNL